MHGFGRSPARDRPEDRGRDRGVVGEERSRHDRASPSRSCRNDRCRNLQEARDVGAHETADGSGGRGYVLRMNNMIITRRSFGKLWLGCSTMERETGFEPATSSLGSWHSTPELLPLQSNGQILSRADNLYHMHPSIQCQVKSVRSISSTEPCGLTCDILSSRRNVAAHG